MNTTSRGRVGGYGWCWACAASMTFGGLALRAAPLPAALPGPVGPPGPPSPAGIARLQQMPRPFGPELSEVDARLEVALKERDLETVRSLVAQGANVNLRVRPALQGPSVPTVLMLAAAAGDDSLTRSVLQRGAIVNPGTVDLFGREDVSNKAGGFTPLMLAVASSNPEVVRMLLAAGADAGVKFANHITALMLADGTGNREIGELLRGAGARSTGKPPHFIVLREGMSGTVVVPKCRITLSERTDVDIAAPDCTISGRIGFRLSAYGVAGPGVTVWGYAGLILIEY